MKLCRHSIENTAIKHLCSKEDCVSRQIAVSFLSCNGASYTFCRYEKAVIAMAKQSVTLEVLSYHASASLEDAQRLRVSCVLVIDKAKLWEA
jgi:hypothetical protein